MTKGICVGSTGNASGSSISCPWAFRLPTPLVIEGRLPGPDIEGRRVDAADKKVLVRPSLDIDGRRSVVVDNEGRRSAI